MLLSKLVGQRVKQAPNTAQIKSHSLMLRAGYIKQVSSGIYTLLMPAKKSINKIENIIREEMDKIGGQEMLFPVVMPRELWEESGRYSSIADEMVRFKDRNAHDMVLGMTHEEAAVNVAKNNIMSYDQLPAMIYQIQTKFRDEARPRAGLIRVREFTMKDAYSFHMTKEDLEDYYYKMYDVYNRIYKRIGMKNFVSVEGDSGMMGGKVSHEFMLLTPAGEDTIVLCDKCNYRANREVAVSVVDNEEDKEVKIELVNTPNKKTIEEVCKYLNRTPKQSCKAVCYAVKGDESKSVVVFIRGDLDVNETKLSKVILSEVVPNDLTDNKNLVAGFIGPYKLNVDKNTILVFDKSLAGIKNAICGGNKVDYHYVGVSFNRDINVEYHDVANVAEGMVCPMCGKGHLYFNRGIEVGNIFQLGTKYTQSMNMTVHTQTGEEVNPIMGCYGIGVGRALASVLEESSDDKGLIFPMSIAPWQVYLCPLRYQEEEVKKVTNDLYQNLQNCGVDVILDDREVSAGNKFAESELMGMPIRIVVSPRSLENNQVELSIRKTGEKTMVRLDKIVNNVQMLIKKEMEELNS